MAVLKTGLKSSSSFFNKLINFSEPSSILIFSSTNGSIPVSDKTENLPPILEL